ncbi:MAG TPA: hypothetical protein VN672_10080 [Solirubrobacteraceae bacterium]|nr:hypothetical protein [Solirubrobacteraceae bacterium]
MTSQGLTIDDLERWVLFGAQWHVVHLYSHRAIVELCACTGGPVERLESHDPAVVDYLRTVQADLNPP